MSINRNIVYITLVITVISILVIIVPENYSFSTEAQNEKILVGNIALGLLTSSLVSVFISLVTYF